MASLGSRIYNLVAIIALILVLSTFFVAANGDGSTSTASNPSDASNNSTSSQSSFDISTSVSVWTFRFIEPILSFWNTVREKYPHLLLALHIVAFVLLISLKSIVITAVRPLREINATTRTGKSVKKIVISHSLLARLTQLIIVGLSAIYFNSQNHLLNNVKYYLIGYSGLISVILILGLFKFWVPSTSKSENKSILGAIAYSLHKFLSYFSILFFFMSIFDTKQTSGNGVVYSLIEPLPHSQRLPDAALIFVMSVYAKEEWIELYSEPSNISEFFVSSLLVIALVIPWYLITNRSENEVESWVNAGAVKVAIIVSLAIYLLCDFFVEPTLKKTIPGLTSIIPLRLGFPQASLKNGREWAYKLSERLRNLVPKKNTKPKSNPKPKSKSDSATVGETQGVDDEESDGESDVAKKDK